MTTVEKPLSAIVTENFNSASVLEKYGLDFCCKGNMSLKIACESRDLDPETIARELSEVTYEESSQRYFQWELPFLIDYIINNHHSYVREKIPTLFMHLNKISNVHGQRHPEFLEVERIFHKVAEDLSQHMVKEEKMLFPAIKMIAQARAGGEKLPGLPFGSLMGPISVMLSEHETAGEELEQIRDLLNDYTPPEDGCTTIRVTFKELEGFEKDLHKHVFLENSILFPKASRMEKE
ncbi:MAG: iron-sulfur cluster repair di-iron protein [Bacteroidota bacterium]|nr:iron-sulfur cluster repair di-iron protein [Bacteroidota bacterium]MDP4230792.1 iron-sulfur cluster repair di-iron protein [Bacteroidota bacterium]MDP4235911.1 iron-sulfur cluster repair di-iron protein [Bacteroidota bacterium]